MRMLCLTALMFLSVTLHAQLNRDVPLPERAKGAARIVVATVTDTSARYERNEHGDELIVTRAYLKVEEAVKGSTEAVTLVLEGGTVDGITMRTSSLPALVKGERALFFLTPGRNGEFKPHLKGQGILKLDGKGMVRGERLTLEAVKKLIREPQP
jgi:hypothetical protein